VAALVLAGLPGAALGDGGAVSPQSTGSRSVPVAELAYDLVSQNGTVTSFGGAANFGGTGNDTLPAPIVGMAATPDGRGYWLVARNGGVHPFGDARFYGSLAHHPPRSAAHDVIALVPTKDGRGYWLCDASGVVTAFGDAPVLPSLAAFKARLPIVGFTVLRSGRAGWVVNSNGDVFRIGDSSLYGNLRSRTGGVGVAGMVRTANGKGYWIMLRDGEAAAFGDASPAVEPPAGLAGKGPVVGITAAPGIGYWGVSARGFVVPGGVPSRGGLARQTGPLRVVAIAAAPVVAPAGGGPYTPGAVGYDVNWPQCESLGSSATGPLPGPPGYPAGTSAYTVAVVGVDGWAVGADNSCLATEVAWARRAALPDGGAAPPYELYLFLNSPSPTSTIDQSGPAGTCSALSALAEARCLAYNYGYNAAVHAVSYARSEGAVSTRWWLDVENDACAPGEWSDAAEGEWWSCEQALDAETVQGALDALRHGGLTPGVYSTALQWGAITGGYVPTGGPLPLWVAGAVWTSPPYPSSYGYLPTSALAPWCSGGYDFAGGTVQLLQETPASNGYPYDPDYAC
jgi:hypothetical protein